MRILAVDYGERRTGLAATDDLGITAQGLDTIIARCDEDILCRIAETAHRLDAERIVLGLPLNMNGTESEKSLKVRVFGEELERATGRTVVFWDERMTSMQAHRVMRETKRKIRGNKPVVDTISAVLMLQEYLKTLPGTSG
jgi:putative holliday junction resolvase